MRLLRRPRNFSVIPALTVSALLGFGFDVCRAETDPADAVTEAPASGGADGAAEMAKLLQDPLASISALMTDNDVLFGAGDATAGYSFQVQPVYAFDFPDEGFTLIARGVFPVLGVPAESDFPVLGDRRPAGGSTTWGLGDSIAQFFVAPKSEGAWRWGIGPQLSLKTRTDELLGGSGWGAGPVGVVTGGVGDFSIATIVGNLWSYDGRFNSFVIQPNIYYNFPSLPGAYVAYNAGITADWKADSDNRWTVPLGLVVGKAFDLGNGHGLDLSIGAYANVIRPDGGANWSLKFGVSFLFPR